MSSMIHESTASQALDFRHGSAPRAPLPELATVSGYDLSSPTVFPAIVTGAFSRRDDDHAMQQRPHESFGDDLTRREIEVLRLVATGATDQSIADALFIARRTVTTHVAAILLKLRAGNRTAAASLAIRNGLI